MSEKAPLLGSAIRKEGSRDTSAEGSAKTAPLLQRIIPEYPARIEESSDELTNPSKPTTMSNMFWTSFNLMNDVLGASIVSQPFYIYSIGFIASPFLYIFFGFVTAFTLNSLFYLGKKYELETYPQLAIRALGTPGYFCACFFIFMFNWGGMVAGLLQIGTAVPSLVHGVLGIGDTPLLSRDYVLLWSCLIFLPLSFFRNIADYAFMSFLSIACLIGLAQVMFIKVLVVRPEALPFDTKNYPIFGSSILSAFGGLSFMFVCHDLSFSVFSAFKDATRPRWAKVVAGVISVAVLNWWLIGYSGLFLVQKTHSAPPPNLLDAFSDSDVAANIGRLLQCLNILISLPYSIFMPRLALQAIAKLMFGPRINDWAFHVMATVILMVSAVMTALFVTDLGFVYEIIGSVSAAGLAYVLPPLMFLRLEGGQWFAPRKLINWGVLMFGLVIMLGGSAQTIWERYRA